jgi:hypothetical protein
LCLHLIATPSSPPRWRWWKVETAAF